MKHKFSISKEKSPFSNMNIVGGGNTYKCTCGSMVMTGKPIDEAEAEHVESLKVESTP